MIPYNLKYSEIEKKNFAKNYYNLNMVRNSTEFKLLEDWCKKYLRNIKGKQYSYEDIVIALPDELELLKDYWEENLSEHDDDNEMKYIITSLYKQMDKKAQEIVFMYSGMKACPYCNGNYIFADSRIKECDFDHYYPTGRYPLLAASFFNLIPSCSYCNRLKNDGDVLFNPHKNYRYEELPHFIFKILKNDFLTNIDSLDVDIISRGQFRKYIEKLHLKELYRSHKDVIQDVLVKKQIYSEQYVDEVNRVFYGMGLSRNYIMYLLYDLPPDTDSFGAKPLSKLIYEIWNM